MESDLKKLMIKLFGAVVFDQVAIVAMSIEKWGQVSAAMSIN